MSDLTTPRFTIARVSAAGDVQGDTIRQWYKRKVLTLGKTDADAEGAGLARMFSASTALAIAIMGALIKVGTSPKIAALAGQRFAQSGDDQRLPGHLYPEGSTALIVTQDDARVRNIDSATSLIDVAADDAVTVLVLDSLVDRVRGKLGLDRDPLVAPKKRGAAASHPAVTKSRAMKVFA